MKREILTGVGIQGIQITINCADMYAAQKMAEEIQKVQESRNFVKEYEKASYDKRKEMFPEKKPTAIELSDEQLNKINNLLCKLFYAQTSSTLFDDWKDDEQD